MILLVGEAYGRTEAQAGEPFVGMAGRYLRGLVSTYASDLEVAYTNICNFWPKKQGKTRPPSRAEIDKGAEAVYKMIEETRPSMVIGLGQVALSGLVHHGMKLEENRGAKRILSYTSKGGKPGWLAFTVHPSYALRFNRKDLIESDLKLFFDIERGLK